MPNPELLRMQQTYESACDEWVAAIRAEEDLALVDPTVAEVDTWEAAHFKEDDARNKAKQAKKNYEDAIRRSLYNF
jgi:hypothetical protein